jgi:putative flippase GtrA
MIQRFVGVVVGGIVTFLLLWLFDDGRVVGEEMTGYVVAITIGALVNLFWPAIWTMFIARRTRDRYDARVRTEVQRQVEAQREPQDEPTSPV